MAAAGRLFAERGYHGTSMRDLGRELGLLGSSLYAHVSSKQDLLVEVVERGSELFGEAAGKALAREGGFADRLAALIEGHVRVVVDHIDVARTFLNEARTLDAPHRQRVLAARDQYEDAFRQVVREGLEVGEVRPGVDPALASIMILSVLNAVERWYDPTGRLDSEELVSEITSFALAALS